MIDIGAYANGKTWIDHSVAPLLVQNAIDGHYGFKPAWALINDADKPKPLDKTLPDILKRLKTNKIDDLTLSETEDDNSTAINLSISNDEDLECNVYLKVPFLAKDDGESEVSSLVKLATKLIKDSQAEYAFIHDSKGWVGLQNERDCTLLFVESCARGAYWVTYFCNEYVERLGGLAKLKAVPALKVETLDKGVLIYACSDPIDLNKEPKLSKIRKLQTSLEKLVPEKYRI